MSKMVDKYYKSNDFIFMDDKSRKKCDVFSEYGYHLGGVKRSTFNEDEMIERTKAFINKDFLNIKR